MTMGERAISGQRSAFSMWVPGGRGIALGEITNPKHQILNNIKIPILNNRNGDAEIATSATRFRNDRM